MLQKLKDIYAKKAKQALHTVTHSLVEFLPFFVCIFFMVFSLITVSATIESSYQSEVRLAKESYDYHVLVSGLDEVGMNVIYKKKYSVFTNDTVYDITDTVRHYSVDGGTKSYDMYLRLRVKGDEYGIAGQPPHTRLSQSLDTFLHNYRSVLFTDKEHAQRVQVTTTPLYELEARRAEYTRTELFALLCTSVVFFAVILFFYRTRVNNKKFIYGIYASFGEDRRRLSGSSVFELYVCLAFVFIPAAVLAFAFCAMFIPSDYRVLSFPFRSILYSIPFSLAAIALSVYFPIKSASAKEALTLLSSDDNSNLVSSPRRSRNMLGRSFPFGYERMTLWRFRYRLIGLLLASTLACSLFVSSVYATDLYIGGKASEHAFSSDFSVYFPNGIPASVKDELLSVDGIEYARTSVQSVSAMDGETLVLIEGDKSRGLYSYPEDEKLSVFDDVSFLSSEDGGTAALLSRSYDYTGTLDCLSGDTVIIADTVDNREALSLEVGDTVTICVYLGTKEELAAKAEAEEKGEVYVPKKEKPKEEDLFLYTGQARIDAMVETNAYELLECTVGAVIHGYPSALYGTPIILSDELFSYVTKNEQKDDTLELHVEGKGKRNTTEIASKLRDVLEKYPDAVLTEGDGYYGELYARTQSYDVIIRLASVVCLPLVPTAWLYSQILFYRRRQGELDLLCALSATESKIKKIHLCDALLLGGLALSCVPLSYLFVRLLHTLYNYVLPKSFLSGANVIVTPSVPISEYISVALASVLSAVLGSVLPYLLFRVRKQRMEYKLSLKLSEVEK